jgi:2-succinyl-5-enolpyruvyl-6-hydroxy-3-cyclohexene-1-carboxylate synthase
MFNVLEDITSTQQVVARLVVVELLRQGVKTFCVSPGARCIPLMEAIALYPEVDLQLFNDERAAAFWALGYAKDCGLPAVLICTSGTAAANYYPAVVEAATSGVPLFVITADRPWELLNCNANQTINQSRLYQEYSKLSIDFPAVDQKIFPRSLLANIDQLVAKCREPFAGVVHLNLAFRKPFQSEQKILLETQEQQFIENWFLSELPLTQYAAASAGVVDDALQLVKKHCSSAKNILISCGNQSTFCDRSSLIELAQRLSAPIFADLYSSIRGVQSDAVISQYYNLYLDRIEPQAYPDLVLHFGGRPVSERLRSFIEKSAATVLVISNIVGRQDALENEFFNVSLKLSGNEQIIVRELLEILPQQKKSGFYDACVLLEREAQASVATEHNSQDNLTEFVAITELSSKLTKEFDLFTSPSLLCREFEHFSSFLCPLRSFGNRGVSGIDGILATVAGLVHASRRSAFVVIGDQATLHDLTSLALIKRSVQPIHVLIFNNAGGAVFNLLDHGKIRPQLVNASDCDFSAAAKLFNLDYKKIQTKTELAERLSELVECSVSTCSELVFDSKQAAEFYRKFKI